MTEDNEDNNKIGVLYILYNSCYGGFGLSQLAIDEFNRRNKLQNPDAIDIGVNDFDIYRTNLLLIEIYKEFGEHWMSSINLSYIPAKYANFYEITDYEGVENVVVNFDAYILNEIKNIIKNNEFNDIKKVFEIELLLKNIV